MIEQNLCSAAEANSGGYVTVALRVTMTDTGVVAERIAAALGTHEPGWQLPRATELARRYSADIDQVHEIIDDLVARQLVRRSPDGRLYRASPPDYLVALDGIPGLGATIDPMSGDLACSSYGVSRRPATEEAAEALRIPRGELVSVLRLAWALNGRPAAVSTTYLARHPAEQDLLTSWLTAGAQGGELSLSPPGAAGQDHLDSSPALRPHSASVQMQLPPPWLIRKLRLAAGQLAVLVTVLFGDSTGQCPTALTTAVLRPDMFRVTIATGQPGAADGSRMAAWSIAAHDEAL
jgi:DNA-binding GntR family transcriptional regulator